MSRYPHRVFAERNKRVQMQNCIEDKFLKQKLDSISREKLYIDRELRRISLAKESLMESLDRYTAPPSFANKRLSLPRVIDGRRKDSNTRPISALRRHTFDSVQDLHTEAERNQKLKPLSCVHEPTRYLRGIPKSPCGERTSHLEKPGSALRTTSLDYQQDAFQIRVASPVTTSLNPSGQNRFTNDRTGLYSRQTSSYETPLHLPRLPAASPAKRQLNPRIQRKISAGQANPRDEMLATNLKSKFRQIGSVVMATAILRIAHDKKN